MFSNEKTILRFRETEMSPFMKNQINQNRRQEATQINQNKNKQTKNRTKKQTNRQTKKKINSTRFDNKPNKPLILRHSRHCPLINQFWIMIDNNSSEKGW